MVQNMKTNTFSRIEYLVHYNLQNKWDRPNGFQRNVYQFTTRKPLTTVGPVPDIWKKNWSKYTQTFIWLIMLWIYFMYSYVLQCCCTYIHPCIHTYIRGVTVLLIHWSTTLLWIYSQSHNNWRQLSWFQRLSSSKLVLKTVESA